MSLSQIVTQEQWLAARRELLTAEKEFTRQRDALSAARRQLPMVRIEKEYVFEGPEGPATLLDLFDGKRQLIVYHFMFDPSWSEGCKHCSCLMDNIAGGLVHLAARDTAFAAVSRAPLATFTPFKRRMGWTFPWFSSFASDFNYDFHVTLDPARGEQVYNYRPTPTRGERPGLSVFLRDGGEIFHTYSTYQRGLDLFLNMYNLLDATPLGRQEPDRGMSAGNQSWVRFHDRYEPQPALGGA